MGSGVSGGRVALDQAPGRRQGVGGVAALAVATGDDELEHTLAQLRGTGRQFSLDQGRVKADCQALATLQQALQVARQQQRLAGLDGDGLEHPIAVGQATTLHAQRVRRDAIDPTEHQPLNRRNTSEPLVPPKPNELDSTTSIGMLRA